MINQVTETKNSFDVFWDEMDLRIENAIEVIKKRGDKVGKQATVGIFFDGGFYDEPIKEFLKLAGVIENGYDSYTETAILQETLLHLERILNEYVRKEYSMPEHFALLLAPVQTKLLGFDIIMILERIEI
jgi:hypothetical protein